VSLKSHHHQIQLRIDSSRMIRNVALVGHSHSGKSALAEWMLYDENVITKRPRPGESVLDFDPAESARHSSVFSRETQ
jgi:translation elongation factor EF-G